MVCKAAHNINESLPSGGQKQFSKKKLLFIAVCFVLLMIVALVVAALNQEPKPDPESERVILEIAAKTLNKDVNDLTNEDFASITNLSIFGKELCDITAIEKFTNLKELKLETILYPRQKIQNWVMFLAKLRIINIMKKYKYDLSPLENLSKLERIQLSMITIKNPKPLASLVNLKVFILIGTNVTDLKPLRELKNLEKIIITLSCISDLEPIKELKNLQSIEISGCDNITDKQVKELQKALPDCKIIRWKIK